jgi:hypothetical protein
MARSHYIEVNWTIAPKAPKPPEARFSPEAIIEARQFGCPYQISYVPVSPSVLTNTAPLKSSTLHIKEA